MKPRTGAYIEDISAKAGKSTNGGGNVEISLLAKGISHNLFGMDQICKANLY